MQIKPVLSAMRHHKAGVMLIALQIALTLAIVGWHIFPNPPASTRPMCS
jgi:hypothetical protein